MLKSALYAAVLVLVLFPLSRTSLAQDSGADTFKAKCQVCHGPDGQGNQMGKALGVVPYSAPEVRKLSNADLTAIIKNGKNNKMPAFGAQLTDAQIKDVLKYIHTLQK
jgi:mono/diheme cytochrome c family protein